MNVGKKDFEPFWTRFEGMSVRSRSHMVCLLYMWLGNICNNVHAVIWCKLLPTRRHIRVLFSSVAFSMGVDVIRVHSIIHLGVPRDPASYMQESERGTYNLLLDDSTVYDALAESRESSDDLFKGTFTEGFPWEVLEVIQGIVYFRFCNCPQVCSCSCFR